MRIERTVIFGAVMQYFFGYSKEGRKIPRAYYLSRSTIMKQGYPEYGLDIVLQVNQGRNAKKPEMDRGYFFSNLIAARKPDKPVIRPSWHNATMIF